MKKLFILLAFAMTLVGCEKVSPMEPGVTVVTGLTPKFYKIDGGDVLTFFAYACDRKTNIAYIYHSAGNRAALSPYYNAEGKIAKCNEVK